MDRICTYYSIYRTCIYNMSILSSFLSIYENACSCVRQFTISFMELCTKAVTNNCHHWQNILNYGNLIPRISNTPIVWFQIYPNMLFHPLPFSLLFTLLSGVKLLLPKKKMASHKNITAGGSFGYQPWRCNGMRLGKP